MGAVTFSVAPKSAGSYTLTVEFKVVIDDKDKDTENTEIDYDKLTEPKTEEFPVKVVEPVKLTVTLKGDLAGNIDPSGVGVYFYVDGEKRDDSYTTFTLNSNGTATVTYNLVEDLSNGSHTFWIESAEGSNVLVQGLGEENSHTFYVGEKSYTVWIALVVLILLIVIIAFVWVYRKPVKNYGKPKARR